MSGGAGGSILAMILSLKNNKALMPKRKSFKELREVYKSAGEHHELKYKKGDPQYIKTLRNQLIKEQRFWFIKRISIISVSLIVVIALFYIPLFVLTYDGIPIYQEKSMYEKQKKEKREAYEMFINYGDQHFRFKEYTLAIRNHQSAVKSSPNKLLTKYNLAIIYYYACLDSSIYCNEAVQTLSEFICVSDTSSHALKLRSEVFMHLGEYRKAEADIIELEKLD